MMLLRKHEVENVTQEHARVEKKSYGEDEEEKDRVKICKLIGGLQ